MEHAIGCPLHTIHGVKVNDCFKLKKMIDRSHNESENREKYAHEIYLDGNGAWRNRNKSKGTYIYMISCLYFGSTSYAIKLIVQVYT